MNFRMWFKYGLKAHKLLAQGSALGIMAISKAPWARGFCPCRACGVKLEEVQLYKN